MGRLTVGRVLEWYDGPLTFLCAYRKRPYLAYLCGRSRASDSFALIPYDRGMVADLEAGRIDLRTALSRATSCVDARGDEVVGEVPWSAEGRALPEAGVTFCRKG